MLTAFGAAAVSLMVGAYAFEQRHRAFVAVFGGACALSSIYAFLAGNPVFGGVEALWACVAVRRLLPAGGQGHRS